jgi:hypothetical protein
MWLCAPKTCDDEDRVELTVDPSVARWERGDLDEMARDAFYGEFACTHPHRDHRNIGKRLVTPVEKPGPPVDVLSR